MSATDETKVWGILYGALERTIAVDPKNFQLLYPYAHWNWRELPVGQISTEMHNFCCVMPQWSGIGKYVSSGNTFHDGYGQFLQSIRYTEDPERQDEIDKAHKRANNAFRDYLDVLDQAQDDYEKHVPSGVPVFADWLVVDRRGQAWRGQIDSANQAYQQANAAYQALLSTRGQPPGFADANMAFHDSQYQLMLIDSNGGMAGKVPGLSVSELPSQWAAAAKRGDVESATIHFECSDESYDFSKSWAGGTTSYDRIFWEVEVSGKWQRIKQFASKQDIDVQIELKGFGQVQIQNFDWYHGAFLQTIADQNGPYQPGISNDVVFGEKGFLPLMNTGLYAAYKPNIRVKVDKETTQSFQQEFEASTGIRVGPFRFGGSGGHDESSWSHHVESDTFVIESTSEVPVIFGVTVNKMGKTS